MPEVSTSMWPPRPTCHDEDYRAQRFGGATWRGPIDIDARDDPGRVSYEPFRTCSFCGSMHPEDLVTAIRGGAVLNGADWKYGWPHKFYVSRIPHAHPEREVWRGGESWTEVTCVCSAVYMAHLHRVCPTCGLGEQGEGVARQSKRNDIFEPIGLHVWGKWYNVHLLDLSADAFAVLGPLLHEQAGIEFLREDGDARDLSYRAPYRGYQR